MDAAETASTLVELTRLAAQVAELQARVAAHADDLGVGDHVGATSTANWLGAPDQADPPRRAPASSGSATTSSTTGPPATPWPPATCWPSRRG